ncbi:Ig-like domain-containing protein [Herbiconiux sp.]|uniref:Ig-like domain-containing protein n=1 Tax=Herbiconiux sp. TaxID=1871186 RepID=UPI0025BD5682|nr:Ig-like domain-containing protein [Herbiconiux sp.]
MAAWAAPSDTAVLPAAAPSEAAAADDTAAPTEAAPTSAAPTDVAPTTPAPSEAAPTSAPPSAAPPETPDPTPVPTPAPEPPVISSPDDGALIDGSVVVAGTATPGSTLQILAGGSSEPLCIVTADASGGYSCDASGLTSSPATSIRVIELAGSGNVSSTITVRVLTAPVVTGGPRGALTNAVVQGTAYPGAAVTASTGDLGCTGTADGSGAWSCPLSGPSGIRDGDYRVSATQTTSWSDGASSPEGASVAIQIDATVPAAPVLLSPAPGTVLPLAGAVFRGTGEDDATVSVFAGPQVLCEAEVAGGSWSCTAAPVPAGTYSLAVLQQDAAGNVSVQSGPLSLAFQAVSPGTPTPTATNTPGSTSPTAPATGPAAPQSPQETDGSAPAPPGSGPGSSEGGGTDPSAPGDDGGTATPSAPPAGSGTWTDATRFSAALQPALGAQAQSVWWIALVAGVLALALIALPSRLLSASVGASVAASARPGATRTGSAGVHTPLAALGRLLGRNRSRVEYDRAPDVRIGPALRVAAALLAAAAIVTLSSPVLGQPAYLRLFLAVIAALFVVNVVATLVPAALARRVFGVVARPRLRPQLLVLAAALALISRLAELDPVLVFGLVAGLSVTGGSTGRSARVGRGTVATLQVLCLLVLGAFAWLAGGAAAGTLAATSAGASGASPELWSTAIAEFTNVVTLASFGSASVLLLPVAGSAGRRILAFSPATWALLALASYTALAMLFAPSLITAAASGALVLPVVLAIGFAAICLSVWAWMRFVADDDDPVLEVFGDAPDRQSLSAPVVGSKGE